MDTSNLLNNICQEHVLTIKKKFSLGNICDAVYLVENSEKRYRVLKIGTTPIATKEIIMNNAGYENLRLLGLDWFIPQIDFFVQREDFAWILMEYCGEDLLTQLKKSSSPRKLIANFVAQLDKVYTQSLKRGDVGYKAVEDVVKKIEQQYETYIVPNFDKERRINISQLKNMVTNNAINFFCFSNWDFTPDDVYLTANGVKYSDPHEIVLGIPIIDMACFAGVMKIHELPNWEEGYKVIKDFAINDLSIKFSLSIKTTEKLFFLGRLLQCFLSARFRLETNPQKAMQAYNEGSDCLEKILNN